MIWNNSQISQWQIDAAQDVNKQVPCLYTKFYQNITAGQSLYTLPPQVRQIERVTWRGWRLEFVSFEELKYLTPATVAIAAQNAANIETSQARPFFFAVSPTTPYDIRYYPTPNESFGQGPDPFSPVLNEPYSVISCWAHIDSTFADPTLSLPSYAARRLEKAYVLWKAFSAEGKGQNLKAAAYYAQRYQFLIEKFRIINDAAYIGQRYCIGDGEMEIDGFKYPRPQYPANFERMVLH